MELHPREKKRKAKELTPAKKEPTNIFIDWIPEPKDEKKYSVFFGKKALKPSDHFHFETYPYIDGVAWIYLDDDGVYKELDMNMYAFDILCEMGNLFASTALKKMHNEWVPILLKQPMLGPVYLEFKNRTIYEKVKKHIQSHCDLAILHI